MSETYHSTNSVFGKLIFSKLVFKELLLADFDQTRRHALDYTFLLMCLGSVPYNPVDDSHPVTPTAGSRLDERVGGQLNGVGGKRDIGSLHRRRIIVNNGKT